MLKLVRAVIFALTAFALQASAQDAGPKQQDFAPASGRGRVVVVISGSTGMPNYTATAQQFADSGFHVVLVDSNDFQVKDTRQAWAMLKGVITRAQASPQALPGKVGVVGYSLGGGAALGYASRMADQVAVVVAVYPATAFIKNPADFIAKTKVPVWMFAGTADTYQNCCLIETARQLAEAAKSTSPPILTLHEYDGVGHGFNLPNAPAKDIPAGQDAMKQTIARLKEALPAQ